MAIFVVLVMGGGWAWWWSSPGQLWWMAKKWEWWVLPSGRHIPGGFSPEEVANQLEPQWSRLLRRQVVTPYRRVWASSDRQQTARFFSLASAQFSSPWPNLLAGYTGEEYRKDGKTVVAGTEGAICQVTIELLLPPERHVIITRIAQEVFGDDGKPPPGDPPPWWLPRP
jgi:hypothetical protein